MEFAHQPESGPSVPEPGLVNPPSRLARLRAALLARPGAHGVGTILLQLLLIVLWHPVLFALAWTASAEIVVPASKFWHDIRLTRSYVSEVGRVTFELPSDPDDRLSVLVLLAFLPAVEGIAVYIPYRVVTRRLRFSLVHFVRLWWRTWLWGTLLIPAGGVLINLLPQPANDVWMLALPAYVLVLPAWFAQREQRKVPRLARWRPVCPECGYSVRRPATDRCPECGQPFPTQSRVYRRWAWRRLTWDRASRGSLFFAYIKTMLAIVFTPRRAARGLLLPDHYPRAIRWGVLHIVLTALLGLALGSDLYFTLFAVNTIDDVQGVWSQFERPPPTVSTVALWATQSLVAWLVAIGVLPLLGILLGVSVPGRHAAAKRGMAKWSLYASPIPLLVLVGAAVANGWHGLLFRGIGWWSLLLRYSLPAPALLLLVAAAYAVWWALGAAGHPYLRRRGIGVFVVHVALYLVTWLLVTGLLFNPDGLRALL